MPDFAYLKFIKVYGLDEDAEECFQGLGAGNELKITMNTEAGTIDVTVPTSSEPEPSTAIESSVWDAQSNIIREQSAFLSDISDIYVMRMSKVPEQKTFLQTMWETVRDEAVEWLIGKAVYLVLGDNAAEMAEMLYAVIMEGYDYLINSYNKASKLCDFLIRDNTALLAMERSRENYAIRSETLRQHDASIVNILRVIELLENNVKTGQPVTSGETKVFVDVKPASVDFGAMTYVADGPVSSIVS